HTRFSRDWSSDVCSSDLRVLLALVAALEKIAGRHGVDVMLAIRPHPRESGEGYGRYTSSVVEITSASGFEGIEWALAADLVVGRSEERRVGVGCVQLVVM